MNQLFSPNPLEEIVTKSDEQINDDDKKYLIDNAGKLNDEEKARFADILPKTEEKPVAPTEDKGITKDQLDQLLEQKRLEWEAKGATPAQAKAEVDRVEEFLKKNGEPTDWKDTFKKVTQFFKENPDEIAAPLKDTIENMTKAEQKELETSVDAHIKGWEKDFNEIAKKNNIPDATTKEGGKIFAKVGEIMSTYNFYDVAKAYDLYTKLNPVVDAPQGQEDTPTDKKTQMASQKRAAGMLGGGSGASNNKPQGPKYGDMQGKTLDQLAEMALKDGY